MNFELNISIHYYKKGLNHKKVLLSMIFITMALKIKRIDLDMINSNSVKNKVSELDKKSGRQFS